MVEILKQAVFVDLASLDAMSSEHGVQVHHGSLLERLSQNRRLVRAVAYGTLDDDRPDAQSRLSQISDGGFKIVSKPLRRRADGVLRASLNVNIAVDALELAPHIELLTLVTADTDFIPLVEAMQRSAVRVELVTTQKLASSGLLQSADAVIDSSGLFDEVRRAMNRPRNRIRERDDARPRVQRSRQRPSGRRYGREPTSAGVDQTDDVNEGSMPTGSAEKTVESVTSGTEHDLQPKQEGAGGQHPLKDPAVGSRSEVLRDKEAKDLPRPVIALPEENLSGRAVSARRDTE